MTRKKKTPRQKIKDKLDDITLELIRKEFNNRCAKCGKEVYGTNSQRSHVKSVGAYPHMEFDLKNIVLLCKGCHLYWWHKEPTEAGAWFKKEFPERFKYLEKAKNIRTHHSVQDLEELYESYKQMS